MFLSVTWNVNPTLFEIFGREIRWYGLLWVIGLLAAVYIVQNIFKRENLPEKWFDSLFVYMMLGIILGARLGHCLFYEPAYFLSNPIEILYVWQGGLASHGGGIGLILGLWLFSRKSHCKSLLHHMDRVAIPTALAGCFIRLGNLFNSEIYGGRTELPWGFKFPRDFQYDGFAHHPTQIYESLGYLIIFIILMRMYKKRKGIVNRGLIVGWMLTLIFTLRFFVEFIKNDQVDFEQNMLLNMGQLLSIPFIIIGIILIIRSKKLGPYKAKKN